MFKLLHNCTLFTCYQSNAQNSQSQGSTVCELRNPDVQAGFRKGRGTRDQIAKVRWIIEKAWEFQKNIYFCFIDYTNAFDCVDHNKLWKILQKLGIPDYLTCFLQSLYAGQEATVRTGHEQQTGFKSGKEEVKAVYCHPTYLTLCRVHHVKCHALWSTCWNQDCQEKYQ